MTSLQSPRWYRVAGLRPTLAAQLLVSRQRTRGETWFLLAERGASARSVRLNAAAWAIAGRFDGVHTLQQIWDHLSAQPDTDPPSQDELIELLVQLRDAALIGFDRPADIGPALTRLDETQRARRRPGLLAWRVRLVDPAPLFDRLRPLQRLLFTRGFAMLWLVFVGALALQAATHAGELIAQANRLVASPRAALLGALLYVPIKLLHESAHGLAVHRFGGHVHAGGLTLVLGMPLPWVDASAATAFARRRERMLVDAAGIAAELLLAALAMPLWLLLADGAARDAALIVLLVCGVSTLVFNANPLQRLDGYHLLTDLLGLPNLATRSRRWWVERLQRALGTAPGGEPLATARGERAWLVGYAPLAWLCSLLVGAWALRWLGGLSFGLGVVAALPIGWTLVLRPATRLLGELRRGALAQAATARRWNRVALGGVALAVVLLALPLPQRITVRGVVWPSDDAQLRADAAGFVGRLEVADGQRVAAGDVVLQLTNPALQTEWERQSARVAALEVELLQAVPAGGEGRAGDALAALAAARAQLERLRERLDALTVHSHVAGQVALLRAHELEGRWLPQGRLIGQVVRDAPPAVRVALPESDAGPLRGDVRRVSVRLASSGLQAHDAQLQRDGAAAVRHLPSAALSERHGGPVPTDPQDAEGVKTLQPVVLLDVQLSDAADARVGERAWVRFDTGFAPLGWQAAQALHALVLRRFNPQW